MGRFKVVIVIPAYNEEGTIAQVVESVMQYGDVIVINDASSDSTEKKAAKAGAIVINNIMNQGYDCALNSGFIEADSRGYNAVITFDADGQHSPAAIEEYISHLRIGVDLVLGVRPKTARIAEWLFMIYTRIRFNWKDPLCGMKGYSMKLYRKQGYFDTYSSIGTELALFALFYNYEYIQLSININNRNDSPRFYSRMLSNLFIMRSLFKGIKMSRHK